MHLPTLLVAAVEPRARPPTRTTPPVVQQLADLQTSWERHRPPGMISHLDCILSFTKLDFLLDAYDKAVRAGYLWHEFGDLCLIAPGHPGQS